MWSTVDSRVTVLTNTFSEAILGTIKEIEGRARNGPLRKQTQLIGNFLGAIGLALQHRTELGLNGEIFGIMSGGLGGLTFRNKKAVTQVIFDSINKFKIFRATNTRVPEGDREYEGPFGWLQQLANKVAQSVETKQT